MKNRNGVGSKAIYWGSTGLFSAMMIASAFAYLTSEEMAKAFVHLGFPSYFRVELAVAKILGAVVLLVPLPQRIKEWAYAGFGITLISGFIAHAAVDGVRTGIAPLVGLAILTISYVFQSRVREVSNTASRQPAVGTSAAATATT